MGRQQFIKPNNRYMNTECADPLLRYAEQNEKLSSFALCMMLCFPQIISAVVNIINNTIGHTIPAVTVALYFTYYFVMMIAGLRLLGRMSYIRFIITGVFLFVLLGSVVLNPKTTKYIWTNIWDLRGNPSYQLLFFGFAAFLLSDYMHDVTRFLLLLRKFCTVSLVLGIAHYASGVIAGNMPQYMTFSYNLLFPTAFLWTCSFSFGSMVLAGVGTTLILIAGCRGALICLLIGVLLYYLFFKEMKPVRRFLFLFFGLVALLFLLLLWQPIMRGLIHLMEDIGVSSRNVEKIINNDFLSDSGRSRITNRLFRYIGVGGYGLFGDRTLASGHYAHNIFVELITDFGWPIGGILFLSWIILILYALIKTDEPGRRLLCVLLPGGCFKLFLSGSFLLQEPTFFLLLGVAINCIMAYRATRQTVRDRPLALWRIL